jgi:hypothetical protein
MSVVWQLDGKYPRATETVCGMLGITHRDLGKFLARGDIIFSDIRNLIHVIEGISNTSMNHYTDVELIEHLRLYWRCKSSERIFLRLDEVAKRSKLEEQGSRGGG